MDHFVDLTNMTAAVIGGTSGIGLAISKALAVAGASVLPSGRRSRQVVAAVVVVEALGSESLAHVANQDSLERLLDPPATSLEAYHILVNCAGRTKRTPIFAMPDTDWDEIIESNLTGTLRACRVFGRHMIEKQYGRIINIASLSSFVAL